MTELHAAADRRRALRARIERSAAFFSLLTHDVVALRTRGSRARQALHQRLALHQVRDSESALHDGERPRARLRAHPHRRDLNYPRAADLPGAGFAAGPCLFKDTMQLAAFNNNNFQLGHAAMIMNEGLPLYVVARLERRFDLAGMTRRDPRDVVQGRVGRHALEPGLQAQAHP